MSSQLFLFTHLFKEQQLVQQRAKKQSRYKAAIHSKVFWDFLIFKYQEKVCSFHCIYLKFLWKLRRKSSTFLIKKLLLVIKSSPATAIQRSCLYFKIRLLFGTFVWMAVSAFYEFLLSVPD